MGEESGVPVGLLCLGYYYFFFRAARKENVTEEEGCLHGILFISIRSRGGEKEELQDVGIYTLLSQILTFEHKKSVGLSCL